jgi:hypothetical protein
MVEMIHYQKKDVESTDEFKVVQEVASNLMRSLNHPSTYAEICLANVPKSSSGLVQACILKSATGLGFQDEAKGLFASYENKLLRPDYFLQLGPQSGILLEIERGKTTINNMDLLDFWKCHICVHANHLFLMVPKELRQNEKMQSRKEFKTVSNRLKSFFEGGNYTNVDSLFLFGY